MSGTTRAANSPREFAAALGVIATGVTLVTIADDRDDVGVTVSAFCPVSMDPPLILVSLIAGSYPAELLSRLDRFAVTVLAGGPGTVAGRFAASGGTGDRQLLDGTPHPRRS
ncbi:MAG: flavin reductase family protein, partial [Streptosporangiaceae bacterium]